MALSVLGAGSAMAENLTLGKSFTSSISVCENIASAREILTTVENAGIAAADKVYMTTKGCGLQHLNFKVVRIVATAFPRIDLQIVKIVLIEDNMHNRYYALLKFSSATRGC